MLDDLVTLEEFCAWMGEDIDTTQPAQMIRQASAVIRRFCRWHIAPQITETITLDGPGTWDLYLPSLYVTDVATIVVRNFVQQTTVTLDPNTYTWSTAGRIVTFGLVPLNSYARSIDVTLTHGYDATPEDVKPVVLAAVARAIASPAGAVREIDGSIQVQHSTTEKGQAGGIALMGHEKEILGSYRIPLV